MLATDPVVAASWRVLKQTLLEASWRWVPGDETDEHAKELARYANECWGTSTVIPGMMSVSWEDQLQYLWEFAPVGYRYAEEVYQSRQRRERGPARMA